MARGVGKSRRVNVIAAHELVTASDVRMVRDSLTASHAELVVKGMLDQDVRQQLSKIVKQNFPTITKNNQDVIDYIVRETIGTGVVEDILKDESITDIGYNGSELIVESNDRKFKYDTNFKITNEYIEQLVSKFAHANDDSFSPKNPIFDGRFENVRINAVHSQNTAPESGATMSLRVVRPRLALTKDNFSGFAPMFIYDFLQAAALTRSNIVMSGITGTGKTELHKLFMSMIPFDDRILLIEDTPETFAKEMFPDKDVYSWITKGDVSITRLIKAGLRNHPVWIMVTETRGSDAYELVQSVLSGHSIATSLHATSARAIPTRFVNMAKMGYDFSEEVLANDIRTYFNFGIHIKKVKYNDMVIRYLHEIVEFDPKGDRTVFKQRFIDGVFYYETYELSRSFKASMEEVMIELDFPENIRAERPLDPKNVTFETVIPLDKTGRPDKAKIKEMGYTVDELIDEKYKDVPRYAEEMEDDFGVSGVVPHAPATMVNPSMVHANTAPIVVQAPAQEVVRYEPDKETLGKLEAATDEISRKDSEIEVLRKQLEQMTNVKAKFERAAINARRTQRVSEEKRQEQVQHIVDREIEKLNRSLTPEERARRVADIYRKTRDEIRNE